MKLLSFSVAAIVVGSTVALAQSELPPSVKARQGQMQIQTHAISILGGMARGNVAYDAEIAAAAAHNLKSSTELSVDLLWPEGTSIDDIEGSLALPAIWSDRDGFEAEWAAFSEAVDALEAAAPNGLDAVRSAIGPVGRGCGSCHDAYRQSD